MVRIPEHLVKPPLTVEPGVLVRHLACDDAMPHRLHFYSSEYHGVLVRWFCRGRLAVLFGG